MGGGGDSRRGGRGRLRRGDLRRRTESVRLLRALASKQDRQGDGGVAPAAWPGARDQDHRQGHVSYVVIVQKFGGTSAGSAARIRRVSRRIADTVKTGEKVVAVVSSIGHTTDRLTAPAAILNPAPPARQLDMWHPNGATTTTTLV